MFSRAPVQSWPQRRNAYVDIVQIIQSDWQTT